MSKKTLYFDKILSYTVTAATENGKLVNCDIEKKDSAAKEGNIYRGIIKNVVEGMQAAFVDCGLERNCYITCDDLCPYSPDHTEKLNLKEGDEVIVQVVKPPVGKKGAKVTTHLSFVGKSIIYLPQTEFTGVSHKITDEELRASLMMEARNAKRHGEGIVIRSAAPFCTYGNITAELDYLRKQYRKMLKNAEGVKKGLIYSDFSLPLRILRDNTTDDIGQIIIGNEEMWNDLSELLPLMPDHENIHTELYAGTRDMLDEYGVAKQIYSAISPRVQLEDGANLVIEHTEALTVIDVNTGKYTGDDNLEQTVYAANLAAAREIARQVKLRNIGGIVVVDFIDMKQEKHRKALAYELNKALQKDTSQCKVLPMSEFGLIQFTRRRTGKGIGDLLSAPCTRCGGKGYTISDEVILISLRAELLRLLSGGALYIAVYADAETVKNVLKRRDFADDLRDKFPSASVSIKAENTYARGEFTSKILKSAPHSEEFEIIY